VVTDDQFVNRFWRCCKKLFIVMCCTQLQFAVIFLWIIVSWVFHWSLCNNYMGISLCEFMSFSCPGLPQLMQMFHRYFMGELHSISFQIFHGYFMAKNSWHFHRRNMKLFHGIFMAMVIFMAHEQVSLHGSTTTEKPMIYLWFYFIAKSWKFHGLSSSSESQLV